MPMALLATFLIVALVFGISKALEASSREKRRRHFLDRPVRPFDEWYDDFYGDVSSSEDIVRGVHEALAEDVGVAPSQIYPNDRYARELYCPERLGLRGHEVEHLELWMREYLSAWEKRTGHKALLDLSDVATVRDTVLRLNECVVSPTKDFGSK